MNPRRSEDRFHPRICEIKVPWLTLEDVTITLEKWLVTEGSTIEIDQDLVELKINGEPFVLPSPLDGVLQTILASPGDQLQTGQELAVVILSPPIA